MDNKNKKKKSNPIVIVLVAVAIFGMLIDNLDSPELLIVAIGCVAVGVGLILALVFVIKKRVAETKTDDQIFTHSHDRLNAQYTECSVDEHWKVQLDGFLKSGIIDRKEYAVLLKNHGNEYDKSSS